MIVAVISTARYVVMEAVLGEHRASESFAKPTVIVVARMNAVVAITDVRHITARNVIRILTVAYRNIVVNSNFTTITMSAVEAAPGKHATRVLTVEARMNIVALSLTNVVFVCLSCRAHPMQIAFRASIVVDAATSRINAARVASGRNAPMMEIAEVGENFVTRIPRNARSRT
jgi:hypothetical protein